MKHSFFSLFLAVLLALCAGAAFAEPDLTPGDTSVRSGPWAEAYLQILDEHAEGIRAYQDYVLSVTYAPACRAVGLTDLTGDGVPELMFLELVHETEYGFVVGRLWIYTAGEKGVQCALTFRPEIDDLLYSEYYLGKKNLLTIHFSDCEMGWIMRFRPGRDGRYAAETTLVEQADFSGEGPDEYFLNGKKITKKKYQAQAKQLRSKQGSAVGSLQVDNGGYGFTHTLDEAAEALSSGKIPGADGP